MSLQSARNQRAMYQKFAGNFRRRTFESMASLGLADGTIDVPGRPGYSYVLTTDGSPAEAYRGGNIPPIWRMPVWIGPQDSRLTILRMADVFANPIQAPAIREHGITHKYMMPGDPTRTGYDWVPVEHRQIMPLRVEVSNADTKIKIRAGAVYLDNQVRTFDGLDWTEMSSHIPATGARYVLVELWNNAGVVEPIYTDGAIKDFSILTRADIPAFTPNRKPLAALRIYAGQPVLQESIYNSDILDLRFLTSETTPDPSAPVDYLTFNTSYTPTGSEPVGTLYWNSTDGTLDLVMSGATQQIGQELFIKVINKSGADIANGSPVRVLGRQGNRPKIYLAQGDTESNSHAIGITTQTIADDAEGFVTTFGYVRQIKTNYSGAGDWGTTWVEGDDLYVSKIIAGQLTNVQPAEPHHSDVVGHVAVVGGSGIGSIFVSIRRHQDLESLADVDGITPVAGSVLVYDGSVWQARLPMWYDGEPLSYNGDTLYY